MKKTLYAIAIFLLVSTLVFLFVTPRPRYDFGESTRRMMDGNAKINRVLDSLYLPPPDSLKGISYGGGARAYMPLTEGNTILIYSTKGNPSRVIIGPCEAELPEGDYMVTMKDGVISVVPIQSTKNK